MLQLWCDNQVSLKNCPVDQKTVCFQAKQIFQRLKEEAGEAAKNEDFKASKGWFSRFKSRCNWHSIAESGDTLYPEKLKKMIEDETEGESPSDPEQIDDIIEEVIDIAKQLNLEVDVDDVQELLDSHNQELTIDELIEMREHDQDIEQTDSLDPVESENQMTISNLTEGLSTIEKGLQILEKIDSNEERVSTTKREIKKLLACYEEILREKKKNLTRQGALLEYMKPSTSK
ncbi:unnamed protein product, partial [Brenthis ino]